jgi:lysine decarboxylase
MRLHQLLRRPRPGLSLHLPAHDRGRALPGPVRRLLRSAPGGWDWPELPEFGGPLEREGLVATAQARLARRWGAHRAWLGVNGASGLLQAALLAMARPGQRVLLPRNHHRSLLHGCVLAGLRPVLMDLPFDPATGLWLPPTAAHLAAVLERAGPVAAAVLVHPTYQGLAGPLPDLVAMLHRRGLPVLVDEAHGTHFAAPVDGLPPPALRCGADLVVNSLHKSAAGLAQTAVLWLAEGRVQAGAVERGLLWLQTSSPSALLLASAEAALDRLLDPAGRGDVRRAIRRSQRGREALLRCGWPLLAPQDPLRLVLHTAALGISGVRADVWLLAHGVTAEVPESGTLTFCPGLRPSRQLAARLDPVLRAMRRDLGGPPLPPFLPPPLPLVAEPELPVGSAWRSGGRDLPLEDCAGRIAAAPLCPYPPGIPLLVPGERIDAERLQWLMEQRRLWPAQIADTVRVVEE